MRQNKQVPIMPIATALWLIDNTSLTFKQIADFCGIHELEVETIANGESAQGIRPINPVISGQLTYEEIKRCSENPIAALQLRPDDIHLTNKKPTKRFAKYTPIARRQDKPDAIFWLLKNYPEIQDSQIIKLIGTTKATIHAIRDKTHWNTKNIRARDPVLLGICNQIELDNVVQSLASVATLVDKGRACN